jgi:hypothetical protein
MRTELTTLLKANNECYAFFILSVGVVGLLAHWSHGHFILNRSRIEDLAGDSQSKGPKSQILRH